MDLVVGALASGLIGAAVGAFAVLLGGKYERDHARQLAREQRRFDRRADAYVTALDHFAPFRDTLQTTLQRLGNGLVDDPQALPKELLHAESLITAFGSKEAAQLVDKQINAASAFRQSGLKLNLLLRRYERFEGHEGEAADLFDEAQENERKFVQHWRAFQDKVAEELKKDM